jgi:TetR/AcrR family transcriptional regulator, transcriptional repressor for nem operon
MVAAREHTDADTPSRILDVAERLVQVRGFNGFSYADIATDLGITKAALHYHYAGKANLGQALIDRYTQRFTAALAAIDAAAAPAPDKLRSYAELYREVLHDRRMCLCGILAAEYPTLPDGMREAVVRFFDHNEDWLLRLLQAGRAAGTLTFTGSAQTVARMIIGCLEGAMLVARPYGDTPRFQDTVASLVTSLTPPTATPAPAETAQTTPTRP